MIEGDEGPTSLEMGRNYLSLFSFLLQGLPSYGSPVSMMAYMMADLYRKGGTCYLEKNQTRFLLVESEGSLHVACGKLIFFWKM